MGKARVAVKIRDVVSGGKSHNRSGDLEALTQRFNVMKKKLALLGASLKRHHLMIVEMNKSRLAVSRFLRPASTETSLS